MMAERSEKIMGLSFRGYAPERSSLSRGCLQPQAAS